MAKKTFYKSIRIMTEKPIYIYYYILEESEKFEEKDVTFYGIEVVKINFNREDSMECRSVSKIYNSFPMIVDLIDCLVRGSVTPIALREIVEDAIASDTYALSPVYSRSATSA